MAELPTTRPSLLVRIRDAGDEEAWRQFVQAYGPVVYGYGRKRGLQDTDAAGRTSVSIHLTTAERQGRDRPRREVGTLKGKLSRGRVVGVYSP